MKLKSRRALTVVVQNSAGAQNMVVSSQATILLFRGEMFSAQVMFCARGSHLRSHEQSCALDFDNDMSSYILFT